MDCEALGVSCRVAVGYVEVSELVARGGKDARSSGVVRPFFNSARLI